MNAYSQDENPQNKTLVKFLRFKFKFLKLSYSPYVDYVHLYSGAALIIIDFFGDNVPNFAY